MTNQMSGGGRRYRLWRTEWIGQAGSFLRTDPDVCQIVGIKGYLKSASGSLRIVRGMMTVWAVSGGRFPFCELPPVAAFQVAFDGRTAVSAEFGNGADDA